MASTCERRSVTYRIFTSVRNTRRAIILGRIDPRLAGSVDVDLRRLSGRRTWHSGHANRRHTRGHIGPCRAGMACDRRRHDSVAGRNRPDHFRARINSVGPLGKMGITHFHSFFCNTHFYRVDIRQILRSIDKIWPRRNIRHAHALSSRTVNNTIVHLCQNVEPALRSILSQVEPLCADSP